jgi:hypothetical protein
MFRRVHARMSWAALNVGAPRQAFQAQTVPTPKQADGRPGVQMMVWSHGPYKCAVIVRRPVPSSISSTGFVLLIFFSLFPFSCLFYISRVTQRRPAINENVLRVKMYESFARVTVFIPHDFHGVVGRVGHSGRSISCSDSALDLKESNSLRFHGVPDATEDLVLVRTEKVLHVCVAGEDPPIARTGRVRRQHV